ncbi:MAG: hypothetical protein L3J13_05270 [Devosiaceae bacterium]|nr:hypothetical protein [Devosiaceae bacterium]
MIDLKTIPAIFSTLTTPQPAPIQSNEPLLLHVTEERSAQSLTRTMHFNGESIYFKVSNKELPPPLETWDFAVIASLFTAMRLGRPIHVCGPVSKSLLLNLESFQEAWSIWLPDLYKTIEITADAEIELEANTEQKGIFAFSGGLDSTFSILRHHLKSVGRRVVEPDVAMLINGFDLDVENTNSMRVASTSAKKILDPMGIPLAVVETNWKTNLCYNWSMEHMAGITACLVQFQGMVDIAVVGSDEGLEHLDIPWGCNPMTNPFLSSNNFKIVTEGLGFTRSQRAAYISENSNLAPHIRVCWENAHTGANCGTCEKCIRTQLNFRAVGAQPQGYLKIANFWQIALTPSHNLGDNVFLAETQREASRRKIYGWWRVACYISIVKNFLMSPVLVVKNKLKHLIRKNETLYRQVRKLVGKNA